MSLRRYIIAAMAILIAAILLLTEAVASSLDAEVSIAVLTENGESQKATTPTLTTAEAPLLSTTTTTVTPPSVTPAVRTLSRTTITSERSFQYSKAVSAIDSTTAATRYGLYNHKILFEAHSRCYYLNRLMRLII
ncbi:MAG: hypothetical protein IJB56_00540 [Alistipes sp.]|nr:hypothetical protein [Alistipes sp.]